MTQFRMILPKGTTLPAGTGTAQQDYVEVRPETTTMSNIALICNEVEAEVLRAVQLHKGMTSQHEAHSVILEEFEEFWEQVKINPKKLSPELQEQRLTKLHDELIQTAAMCVRAIHDLRL